jgi:signal transduction histidine kinase
MLPGFVEITITDTGIGISPKDQTGIFEKFGQLGRTDLHSSGKTKFKGGGPGLGLSITKGIIEAHGGTIWVESEGCDEVKLPGSTFHILLPTHAEPTDPRVAKLFGDAEKK